ncbi:MAG: hypothetical protein GY679_04540 [Mycoplasma sp.]|nr:hypothetical protein [Mycoplasma sp.]
MKNTKKIVIGTLATVAVGVFSVPTVISCSIYKRKKSSNNSTNGLNTVVKKFDIETLKITGVDGAGRITIPASTKDYNVKLVDAVMNGHLRNHETITLNIFSKHEGGTINGKYVESFEYEILGLSPSKNTPDKDKNVTVKRPEIKVTGYNGSGRFDIPTHPNMFITASQNTNLKNGDQFSITYRAKVGYKVNGKIQEKFTYTVKGLKNKIVDLNITKPNINFNGFDGSATFVLPKIDHTNVTASKTTGISNGETIVITVTAKTGYTVNGQSSISFNYLVANLKNQVKDIHIKRPTIVATGINGSGVINLPTFTGTIVTASKTTGISNGDTIVITVTAKPGYTVNGNNKIDFSYVINNLTAKVKDIVVPRPNLTFQGNDKSGWFDLPAKINGAKWSSNNHTSLSNGDSVSLTITADSGYTVNGKKSDTFTYTVKGLNVPSNKTLYTAPQGYDLNDINTKVVTESGEKTIYGFFGSDYKKSPIIFASSALQNEGSTFDNAPSGKEPFIPENQMEEFMKMWFKYVNHGPEITNIGMIWLDLPNRSKKGVGGTYSSTGLLEKYRKRDGFVLDHKPNNTAKGLIMISSPILTRVWASGLGQGKINFNNVKEKFKPLFNSLQHEYGHSLVGNHSIQSPIWDTDNSNYTKDTVEARLSQGYKNGVSGADSKYYLPKIYVESFAKALGLNWKDKNDEKTVLTELLAEKQRLEKAGQPTDDIKRKLALWNMRAMIGTIPGEFSNTNTSNSFGALQREKAFLYPGYSLTNTQFDVSFQRLITRGITVNPSRDLMSDYASGADEMSTRLLTLMSTKEPFVWGDQMTFSSIITGLNPYYKLKSGVIDFQKPVKKDRLGVSSSQQENSLIFSDTKNLDNKAIRIEEDLQTKRRDEILDFYLNTTMGYNKSLSYFQRTSTAVPEGDEYIQTYFGGYTPVKHEYLLISDTADPRMISGNDASKNHIFKIQDPHGVLKFRKNGSEDTWNRSLDFNKRIPWYVDLSGDPNKTKDLFDNKLDGNFLSFWDDKNKDGAIQESEVTQIPWTEAKEMYPTTHRMFSSAPEKQVTRGKYGNKFYMVSSKWDSKNSYVLTPQWTFIKLVKETTFQ